jgi:protein-disulfide isomerase
VSNDRKQRAEQMRKERERAEKRQRNVITVAIVVVVVALVGVGAYAVQSASVDKNTDLVAPKNTTEDYGIVYTAADAAGASATPEASESPAADAEPVEVALYEDFQCPACRSFEETSGPFLKQQVASGAIEIVYHPFSFLDNASLNEYSSRSTNVALCALDAGGVQDYVKVHDYLYANQPDEQTAGPENAELIRAVGDLGITGIDECVRSERFIPWIEEAANAARTSDREVSATPTVFVGGKKVDNPSPAGLQQAITAAASS